MRSALLLCCLSLAPVAATAAQDPSPFTRADTLRGSNTPQRAWWDVRFYDLHVTIMPSDSVVRGWNAITYGVLAPSLDMQIDLQAPLDIDSVVQAGQRLAHRRDGSAFFVTFTAPQHPGAHHTLTVFYHGKYPEGGGTPFFWAADSVGAAWVATSDELIGASSWWPLKDYPADEPDSQRIALTVPDPMIAVSNGRLRSTTPNRDGTTTFEWFVTVPINSYNVAVNASANYVHFGDVYQGESGPLTVDFWPLSYNRDTAVVQFQQTYPMLACFEGWFGPYPWYDDGFKLIETPYLGMEHQSGIAYGNRYLQGYRGKDLSGTGLGMAWDFIIVHESAHEWWGNSISAKDHAEMWLHEGFAMYAEGLYTECQQGKEAGERYLVGLRARIKNDMPIVGHYGVSNTPKSQDRYYKGSNMLLTIRQVINDDAKWRDILRGLNRHLPPPDGVGASGRGLHQRAVRRGPEQDIRAVSDDYLDPRPRIPDRREGRVLPLDQCGSGIRHAGAGHANGRATLHADSSHEAWQTAKLRLKNDRRFSRGRAFLRYGERRRGARCEPPLTEAGPGFKALPAEMNLT